MAKPKVNSMDVKFPVTGDPIIEVRFQDVDVELLLAGRGFTFNDVSAKTPQGSTWQRESYKLVKNPDHILLEHRDRTKAVKQTGVFSNILSVRRDGYQYRYPHYGNKADATREIYGSQFRFEMAGKDIKLFPINMNEAKQIRKEILDAIKRYENENNLISNYNEI